MSSLVPWMVLLIFLMKIKSAAPGPETPSLEIVGDTGYFLSPGYPQKYAPYENVEYKVYLRSPGPQWVRIYLSLDLQNSASGCRDYIRINNGRLFCGRGEGYHDVFLEGAEFSVLFCSDYTIEWTGFNVSYKVITDQERVKDKAQDIVEARHNSANNTLRFADYASFTELPFYLTGEFVVSGVANPLIIVAGLLGNSLTIIVMRRLTSKASCYQVYLMALAASDLVVVLMEIGYNWLQFQFEVKLEFTSIVWCKTRSWIVYSFGTLSSWLLVATTAQRSLAVLRPLKVNVICTTGRARGLVMSLAVVIFAMHSNLIRSFDIIQQQGVYANWTSCEILMYEFFAVWSVVDLFVSSLVPFCLLGTSNAVLVWTLARSLRHAQRQLNAAPHAPRGGKRTEKVSSLSLTLVMLSLVYFLLTAPVCVQLMVENLGEPPTERVSMATHIILLDVWRCLWRASFAVNFYLYLLTGSKFRNEVYSMIVACSGKWKYIRSRVSQTTGTCTVTSSTCYT